MSVLNGREVQMLAPHERCQRVQEPLTRSDIPRARACFDIGRALPCTAKAFIVALCCFHRHANRCHPGIRAQTQIGAKNIPVAREIIQHRRHTTGRAHKRRARIMEIIRLKAGFIKQANEVDIGRIIQLERPHFPHSQHRHATCIFDVVLRHARKLAARNLCRNTCAQGRIDRKIRKLRQHLRDLLQAPNSA